MTTDTDRGPRHPTMSVLGRRSFVLGRVVVLGSQQPSVYIRVGVPTKGRWPPRVTARIPVLLMLVGLLAACATTSQATPTPQTTSSPEVVKGEPPLVLTLWHSWSGRGAQALDMLARGY